MRTRVSTTFVISLVALLSASLFTGCSLDELSDDDTQWSDDDDVGDDDLGDDDTTAADDDDATAGTDADGDGWTVEAGDCDDTNPSVHPGAAEICNGLDDDCDDITPGDEEDADGDGYRICEDDCDDSRDNVHPAAAEECDELDNDCDGSTDEGVTDTYYRDSDGDGYGDAYSTTEACPDSVPSGYTTDSQDCNDGNGAIHPAATEVCDGQDNDCDGSALPALNDDGYEENDAFAQATALSSGVTYSFQLCRDHTGVSEYDYLWGEDMGVFEISVSAGVFWGIDFYDSSQTLTTEYDNGTWGWTNHTCQLYRQNYYAVVRTDSGGQCSCVSYSVFYD